MKQRINAAQEYLKKYYEHPISIALILGSGLKDIVDILEDKIEVDYSDVPYFNEATVEGHVSKLVFGKLHGKHVVCMTGRLHYYEGYSMREITFPVYVFNALGATHLILTNSCGGINDALLEPGDVMVLNDFINFMSSNPLIGPNDTSLGERFPDMTEPYDIELRQLAKSLSSDVGIPYKEGVYTGFSGPYYETKAEIRMMKQWGSDAVGMSTVPETLVGHYLGMKVLAFATITNMATGIQKKKHSHENVIKVAKEASDKLKHWIERIIEKVVV
jgi:purine-nucleoside phosphorylase